MCSNDAPAILEKVGLIRINSFESKPNKENDFISPKKDLSNDDMMSPSKKRKVDQ